VPPGDDANSDLTCGARIFDLARAQQTNAALAH
jgi:hypothetical protein